VDYGPNYAAFSGQGLDGGHIAKLIFPFPGGRRFHFTEPAGNEFAVWSDGK
jgi:predicted enzyme related to lactoylglutathione lyase